MNPKVLCSLLLMMLLTCGLALGQSGRPVPKPDGVPNDVDLPNPPPERPATTDPTPPQPLICSDLASTAWLKGLNESLWKSLVLLMDEESLKNETKFEADKKLNTSQIAARRVDLIQTLLKAKRPQ